MLSACPVLSSAGCPRKRDLTHPLTAGCFQTSSSPPTSVTNNPRSLNPADRRNEPLFPATPFTYIPPSEKSSLVSGGGQRCSEAPGAQPAAGAHLPGPFSVPPAPLRPGAALPALSAAPRPGGAAARPGERRGRC